MALSQKKLTKAVKDAQKQAEAAVADMRSQSTTGSTDVTVDPTPFYAVVGAATSRSTRSGPPATSSRSLPSRPGPPTCARAPRRRRQELQKDLQKRIKELQNGPRSSEDRHDVRGPVPHGGPGAPAQVLNQGLVIASNAKDQYDAAAARGEKVVADLRATGGARPRSSSPSARRPSSPAARTSPRRPAPRARRSPRPSPTSSPTTPRP